MNKNILIKAASLVLVAGVLLTSFGCKKGEEGTTTAPATTVNGEVAIPPTVDGTYKVQLTIKDENGSTTIKEKDGDLYSVIVDKPLDKCNKNIQNVILNRYSEFGLEKAEAEDMVKAGTKWTYVSVYVYVLNSNAKDVSMRMLKANQTESLIVDTNLDTEFGIPSGRGMYVALNAYIDMSKYETEEAIVETLNSMDIQFIYTLMDNSADSVDDWSKVTTVYMPVKL